MKVRRWSEEEDAILMDTYMLGAAYTHKELTKAGHRRSEKAIQSRACELGAKVHSSAIHTRMPDGITRDRPLTEDSIEMIHWYFNRGYSVPFIACELNRTPETVEEALRLSPSKPKDSIDWLHLVGSPLGSVYRYTA